MVQEAAHVLHDRRYLQMIVIFFVLGVVHFEHVMEDLTVHNRPADNLLRQLVEGFSVESL